MAAFDITQTVTVSDSPELDRSFPTRAEAVSAIALGTLDSMAEGLFISAAGLDYLKMPAGHALYGTDPISDMPGYIPVGDVRAAHFGAEPGATDCSDKMQEAIDYLSAAGGGVLHPGAGTFTLDTPRSGDDPDDPATGTGLIVLKDGVSIQGEQRNLTTFKRGTSSPQTVVWVNGGNDRYIRGVTIDVNDTDNTTAVHAVFKQLNIDGFDFSDNRVKNTGSYAIGLQDAEDGSTGYTRNTTIQRNIFENIGADCIDCKGRSGDTNAGNICKDNVIVGWGKRSSLNGQAAVDVRGEWVIESNRIVNDGVDDVTAIRLRQADVEGVDIDGRYSRVTGNRMYSDTVGTTQAIDVNCDYARVSENFAEGFWGGYLFEAGVGDTVDDNAASDNVAKDCTFALRMNGTGMASHGMVYIDCGTLIYFGNQAESCVVTGGKALGSFSTGINDNGTDNNVYLVDGLTAGTRMAITPDALLINGAAEESGAACAVVEGALAAKGARFPGSARNIGDDTAIPFTPTDARGVIMLNYNNEAAAFHYNTINGNLNLLWSSNDALFTFTDDTEMTGTSGGDGTFNIGCTTAGVVSFENRTGTTQAMVFSVTVSRD